MKIAIYPGTFDPITFGHIDIIRRASELFDYLIVAVAKDNYKNPLFTLDERIKLIANETAKLNNKNISVEKFEGLLVEFACKKGCCAIIRGLRAVSDFEFEFQMFGMNSRLDPTIQTIFLPASESNHFIASRLVKEVARLGGDVSSFVSTNVRKALLQKLTK
ncbi:MAG: pantetheine-phosphate adenylyltransferase [Alphaproteobacteria bacterium]|nr:pantetheine-phosphate adenylyltransferase [Alphaproteobacteria bacterium]